MVIGGTKPSSGTDTTMGADSSLRVIAFINWNISRPEFSLILFNWLAKTVHRVADSALRYELPSDIYFHKATISRSTPQIYREYDWLVPRIQRIFIYIDAKVTSFAKQNKKTVYILSLLRLGRRSCLIPHSCDQGMTARSGYVWAIKGAETQVGAIES